MKKLLEQLNKALDAAQKTRNEANKFIGGGYMRATADITVECITEAIATAKEVQSYGQPNPAPPDS